jgi:hypothetical protein
MNVIGLMTSDTTLRGTLFLTSVWSGDFSEKALAGGTATHMRTWKTKRMRCFESGQQCGFADTRLNAPMISTDHLY